MSSQRFSRIDKSNIGDHYYLETGDDCYFLYEYTSRKDYSFSKTNSLIFNLKKSPSKQHTNPNEFGYKMRAIEQCSREISQCLDSDWLANATLVPTPPSKVKSDREYDDRILQVCNGIKEQTPTDVRELVFQKQTIRAAHESASGARPSVDEISDNYDIECTKTVIT